MLVKTFPADFKAATDGSGTFEAIVSVFNNVDLIGDVVLLGAFADVPNDPENEPVPVVWSHSWQDPFAHIGALLDHAELAPGDGRLPAKLANLGGWWTKGGIDLEPTSEGGPARLAEQVTKLLRTRRVREFSFAYDIVDGGSGERDGKRVFELRKLDVFEVGPTLKGMNPATELLDAKRWLERLTVEVHDRTKAGRVLSAANEDALREAAKLITGVLSKLDSGDDTATDDDGKAEEPAGAKAEDHVDDGTAPPAPMSPASVRVLADLAAFD
jgi:uncharacterized protein